MSRRTEVAIAGPRQRCSIGIMTWVVFPCRAAARTRADSSAEIATFIAPGMRRPRTVPTSSASIRSPSRDGRIAAPIFTTAVVDSACCTSLPEAKPRLRRGARRGAWRPPNTRAGRGGGGGGGAAGGGAPGGGRGGGGGGGRGGLGVRGGVSGGGVGPGRLEGRPGGLPGREDPRAAADRQDDDRGDGVVDRLVQDGPGRQRGGGGGGHGSHRHFFVRVKELTFK